MIHSSERSVEQRYGSAVVGLYARLRSDCDFVYEKRRDKGSQLHLSAAGMAWKSPKKPGNRGRKLISSDLQNKLIRMSNYASGAKEEAIEAVEWSERIGQIKARECPLHFDKREICLANTTTEKTTFKQLNFDLTCKIGKSIRAGEPYGEHDRSQDLPTAYRSYCRRRDKVT